MALSETAFWIATALAPGRRHGYAILQDAEQASGGAVRLRVTTLYAALDRMQRDGSVAADGDEVVQGRARRYFVLTDAGRDALAAETDRLEARARAARAALARRPAPAPALAVAR